VARAKTAQVTFESSAAAGVTLAAVMSGHRYRSTDANCTLGPCDALSVVDP
jgi:hypothetical protein